MDEFPPKELQPLSQRTYLAGRIGNAIEILLVALFGSILVPMTFAVMGLAADQILQDATYLTALLISEATVTLLLIIGLLILRGQRMRDLGWRKGSFPRECLTGLALVPILFLATFLVGLSFQLFFPEYVTEKNPLLELVQDRGDLALMIFSSIYVGGIKEEIQRAFILNRFEENLGGALPGLLLWSGFFGYGHLVQGVDNAVGAGILGLLFGILYLSRRSLTGPICSHALYNVLTVILFWNFFGGIPQALQSFLGSTLFGFLF